MKKKGVDYDENPADLADRLALLGNETRLRVLAAANGERTVGALTEETGVSGSAISQHLAKLKAYGLVSAKRDAQELRYTTDKDALRGLLAETAEALGL